MFADLALLAAQEETHEGSCHFETGDCGFPAPSADIFELDPSWELLDHILRVVGKLCEAFIIQYLTH